MKAAGIEQAISGSAMLPLDAALFSLVLLAAPCRKRAVDDLAPNDSKRRYAREKGMSENPVGLSAPPEGYGDWLADLKGRIHNAQQRARWQ